MQNVLYVGPYKENNGLGRSSRRHIRCLQSMPDLNLSIRPIFFTSNTDVDEYDQIPISYEQQASEKYDTIIQHGYPDMFIYDKKFGKHIGVVEIETMNLTQTGWIDRINLLDEVVVGSTFAAESLESSGVNIPIRIMLEPYNISEYSTEDKDFFEPSASKPFIFYTIGQYTDKKNLKAIVLAFLLEFDGDDNVKLFIKTGRYGEDKVALEQRINFEINHIHQAARNTNPPDINILVGHVSTKDMIRLHKSCDCYVDAVRAEANGACAIEATLADNLVIVTQNIGSNTFIGRTNGFVVDSFKTNVLTDYYYNKRLFSLHEDWYEPHIISLQSNMRECYELNQKQRLEKLASNNKQRFSLNRSWGDYI